MDAIRSDDSAERAMLRVAVRELAESFGHSYFADSASAGRFPVELWDALGDAGYSGVNVASDYGGGGGGLTDLVVVAEELAAAGCPLMTLVVSPAVCAPILARYGTHEQKQRWLTPIGTGEARMSFAITEPEAGSNSHAIRTRAERTGSGWVINGAKHYISGVDDAQALMLMARTGLTSGGRGALSIFIVDTRSPGLSWTPIRTAVHAAERQFIVTFDDVCVGGDSLIGEADKGLGQVFEGLNPERILSAATCTGIARYALSKGVAYARQRHVWGVAIGSHQAVAHPLARSLAGLHAARLVLYQASERFDAGESPSNEAAMAKLLAAHAAEGALDTAIQVHGGNGLAEEYGLSDLWGLVRLYRIAPVSDEMTLNHIAAHALGLPKSY
jgi:alkylation response protein AidB-like acyl-CoA dehydrogenase